MITIELFNQPVVVPFSLNETLQLVLLAVRDAQSACQNRMWRRRRRRRRRRRKTVPRETRSKAGASLKVKLPNHGIVN